MTRDDWTKIAEWWRKREAYHTANANVGRALLAQRRAETCERFAKEPNDASA